MKTFTAKQFSRTPKVIFDAARQDGSVRITHEWFNDEFIISYTITRTLGDGKITYKTGDEVIQNALLPTEDGKGPEGPKDS